MTEVKDRTAKSIAADGMAAHKSEFLADRLDEITAIVREIGQVHGEHRPLRPVLERAHRLSLDLKGGAGSLNLSLLGIAAHRLEDYLDAVDEPYERHLNDIEIYLDVLTELLENGGVGGESAAHLVRRLPPRRGFDAEDITVCEIEVLLVMDRGVVRRMIEREIAECGYRVTSVSTPFHALEMIVRTQPDLVIISAVLADLSGVDLAAGLKAMPQTRNTGMALITSYAREHDSLKYLPPTVPIIRKGESFADDLTSALNDQFII